MSSGFGVDEVGSEAHYHQDNHEHDVVFPGNGLKGDWVDKGIEEDCRDSCDPSDRQATGAECIRPDLARVSNKEWGTVRIC